MSVDKTPVRPTLRSVIGRGHLSLALMAVAMASVSLTLLGVLALRVYADHNLHLIARSINYTVEAAVVFNDSAAATEALAVPRRKRWPRPRSSMSTASNWHIGSARKPGCSQ